jgi:hypothetical protein
VTKVVQNLSVTTVVPLIQILSNGSKSLLSDSMYSTKTAYAEEKNHYEHGKTHYSKNLNEPNTALLSTILIFGTFLIAYFLRIFRNSRFLGRSVSIPSNSFICAYFPSCNCKSLFVPRISPDIILIPE